MKRVAGECKREKIVWWRKWEQVTRTHLLCRQRGKVDVSPLLFNGLAMRASYTMSVIEGVLDLALWAMCR